MPTQKHNSQATVLVACLCAEWCGTCKDYRAPFFQLQAEFPDAKWVWIDIEDESDLVDAFEVDNFPTLLIASGDEPLFFGTITPHIDTLRRLIQTHHEPGRKPLPQADALKTLVHELLHRI